MCMIIFDVYYGPVFLESLLGFGVSSDESKESLFWDSMSWFTGPCFWKGKGVGGSLGKVGSFSPVLLRHVIGQVRYGRGRKGEHKCWKQSLAKIQCSCSDFELFILLIGWSNNHFNDLHSIISLEHKHNYIFEKACEFLKCRKLYSY